MSVTMSIICPLRYRAIKVEIVGNNDISIILHVLYCKFVCTFTVELHRILHFRTGPFLTVL